MIGIDEPMALVVMSRGIVKEIFYLGNSTLESGEFDQLDKLAEEKGFNIYLTTVSEDNSYDSLYRSLGDL